MKYKIIGVINLFLGLILTLLPILMVTVVMPRLSALYSESSFDYKPYQDRALFTSCILLLFGLSNLFLGFKLFSKDCFKYFKWAIICIAITLLLAGNLVAISTVSLISPTYKITE